MIARNIPVVLKDHLKQPVTSIARYWKVTKVGLPPIGLTTHDVSQVRDDGSGDGPLNYIAHRGYSSYALQADSDLNVDNSEMEALVATNFELSGITLKAIESGDYDDAEYVEYIADFTDTAAEMAIISSGFVGRIRTIDGLVCFPEIRSLTQTLKQKSLIQRGSISCRVKDFGDAECQYDVESEWANASVDVVGAETDRTFSISGSGVVDTDDYYWPGVFEFDESSNNPGKTYEIESYVDGVVTLAFPTPNPILPTDGGRIRRDCTRSWEGHNSCQTYANRPNFLGEPMRQIGDTATNMIPGAGGFKRTLTQAVS